MNKYEFNATNLIAETFEERGVQVRRCQSSWHRTAAGRFFRRLRAQRDHEVHQPR